jgi:hypothetical protein
MSGEFGCARILPDDAREEIISLRLAGRSLRVVLSRIK